MNINSYAGYSNSLLNPYTPVSNSQAVNPTQNTISPSQDALNQVLPQPQPSSSASDNGFSVNISQEAMQTSQNATQQLNTSSSSASESASPAQRTTVMIQTQQMQQAQQTQQEQQVQQMQSQFYQSPYGAIPLSRSSIDLMA